MTAAERRLARLRVSFETRNVSLHRIIYVSRVARHVRFADAEQIAEASAARNAECGITGILVYSPAHFIQVLEGERAAVETTLQRIQRDARHSALQVVTADDIGAREFSEWAMAARRLRGEDSITPGSLDASRALDILRRARDEM